MMANEDAPQLDNPLTQELFTQAKHRTIAKDEAEAAKAGKALPKSYRPSVSMTTVRPYGPYDEVDLVKDPDSFSSKDKVRRAAMEASEKKRQKEASEKARKERLVQKEREDQEHNARRKAEEEERVAKRKARGDIMRAMREANGWHSTQSINNALANAGPRKRKREATETDEHAKNKSAASPNTDSSKRNGQSISRDIHSDAEHLILTDDTQADSARSAGTRLLKSNGRVKPVILESDDEEDLPSAKRLRSRDESAPEEAADHKAKQVAGEKSKEAAKGKFNGGCNDLISGKRKRDEDDHESDDSDNEPLAQKRRKFQNVRPESDKENLSKKTTSLNTATKRRSAVLSARSININITPSAAPSKIVEKTLSVSNIQSETKKTSETAANTKVGKPEATKTNTVSPGSLKPRTSGTSSSSSSSRLWTKDPITGKKIRIDHVGLSAQQRGAITRRENKEWKRQLKHEQEKEEADAERKRARRRRPAKKRAPIPPERLAWMLLPDRPEWAQANLSSETPSGDDGVRFSITS